MSIEVTYFEDGQIDRVMGLLWQVAQETYVTQQRVLALEEILVEKGTLLDGELDRFNFSETAQERLTNAGLGTMERLLRTISEMDDRRTPLREQFADELADADR